MKRRTSGLRFSTAGILGQGLVGSLFLTVRFETMGEEYLQPFRESGTPIIFVFWHGRLLPLIHGGGKSPRVTGVRGDARGTVGKMGGDQ